jgi:hypothetical protein
MPVSVVVFLVLVGVLVLGLALSLITIAGTLAKISSKLGPVLGGTEGIANQTKPVNPVVAGIAGNVTSILRALEGVLAKAAAAPAPPPPSPREISPAPAAPTPPPARAPRQSASRGVHKSLRS